MTNEEIEALSAEAIDLFSRKTENYEEANKNLERTREIHDIIHRESLDRLEESYQADGIDPYVPCPTCGHIRMRKR